MKFSNHSKRNLVAIAALGTVLFGGVALAEVDLKKPTANSKTANSKTTSLKAANNSNTNSLKMWRVLNEAAFRGHGKVVSRDGQIQLGKGELGTGVAWKGKMPTTDYEVHLEAKRIAGKDFFCGITFPVMKKHCSLILGGWGGQATGISNIDDEPAVENETVSYHAYKSGKWYKIRLRVTTDKIEAWLDKKQIVDLETTDRELSLWLEQEPARPLGISSWETSAAFRNLQIKPINVNKSETVKQ